MISHSGILLLNKPSGITSNNIIQKIKRICNIKKIGHAGTLDKFANGLLIVLIGDATKLSDMFLNLSKTYQASLYFGKETDTLDPEGAEVLSAPIPDTKTIYHVISQYQGALEQYPPQYSAIHIDGKRASKLVRAGQQVEMPKRAIHIYENTITNINVPLVEIFCNVSKGTYIRALARDIGKSCNSCAHLSMLCRKSIGKWELSQSVTIEELEQYGIIEGRGFVSIDTIMQQTDHTKVILDDTHMVRNALVNGIQPNAILATIDFAIYHYVYIYDKYGSVGVWKKHDDKWKLILTCKKIVDNL